jgi:ornithine cyclodeaminase
MNRPHPHLAPAAPIAPTAPMARVGTQFLSAHDAARLVQHQGLPQTLAGLAKAIELDFRRWPDFDKSPRTARHAPEGVIELMPIADEHLYSFKFVNGHPGNTAAGLSTVMAFGVLADMHTGTPLLVSELTLSTALRTAATSAMAARTLARPGSQVMAIIGNGAQSAFQAIAFQHLVGITTVRLFDIDLEATQQLMHRLGGTGLHIRACHSVDEALHGADIVTTLTADKTQATIVQDHQVRPGMHLNAVGGDCPGKTELDAHILRRSRVFVEYEPQTRQEGELQQMEGDFPVTELWRVLTGQAFGRQQAHDITVFDSVGFALEDFSTLRYLHGCASMAGLLRPLDLIAQPDNPKDLMGWMLRAPATHGH